MEMQKLYLLVPLAPLVGAMIAGLFCRVIPRWLAHTATIAGRIAMVAKIARQPNSTMIPCPSSGLQGWEQACVQG